jgi:hypothetical protein
MDREFENAAKGWISQYKADIKGKIENLLDENDATPEELAEEINVDVEEIYDILDGNAEDISVYTLIKVFMVLGLAIEIKPIEQTPLGGYDNINPHVERPQFEERREPRPNPFTQRPNGMGGMPPHGFDPDFIPPHVREQMERDFGRRQPMDAPRNVQRPVARPTSPFAEKTREELVYIIRKHQWDTEIDIQSSPKDALVRFLDDKNRRINEFKRMEAQKKRNEEVENDPKVADFVKKMKESIKSNPQFRNYMKQFLGQLNAEE